MTRHSIVALLALFATLPTGVSGQTVNFSGTWVLDSDLSTIVPGSGLARIGDGGSPKRLHITHSRTGDVTLLSEVNESQARTYKIRADSLIPVSQDVDMIVTSRWDNSRFIAEGQQRGADISSVRRVLILSPDGTVLTLKASTTIASRETTSILVYTKTTTVPACSEWSTPCLR